MKIGLKRVEATKECLNKFVDNQAMPALALKDTKSNIWEPVGEENRKSGDAMGVHLEGLSQIHLLLECSYFDQGCFVVGSRIRGTNSYIP